MCSGIQWVSVCCMCAVLVQYLHVSESIAVTSGVAPFDRWCTCRYASWMYVGSLGGTIRCMLVLWVALFGVCWFFGWHYSVCVGSLGGTIRCVLVLWVALFGVCWFFGWHYSVYVGSLGGTIRLPFVTAHLDAWS